MNVPKKTKHRFKVGDRVRFRFGGNLLTVKVVEDLGSIGVGGQQLVRVEVPLESTSPHVFDVRASSLTPVSRRRVAA
jgi:hypothetical protein